MTSALDRLAHRGENLLAVTVLGLGGLVFGTVVFQEADWSDKVDDAGFLVLGLGAVAWYLWRENRYRHSGTPITLAIMSVVVQIAGLVLERDDPKAFGDNIGGLMYFGIGLGLVVYERRRCPSLIRALRLEDG